RLSGKPLSMAVAVAGALTVPTVLAIAAAMVIAGGGFESPPPFVGRWKGAPFEIDVHRAVEEIPQKKLNPAVEGFVEMIIQKGADELLTVTLDFRRGGAVSISGNTRFIGVSDEFDGSWEVLERRDDVYLLRLYTREASIDVRLTLHDRRTFL